MRKLVLAMVLALAAVCGTGALRTHAMEGFDLGDMPPLPPPLLDADASAPPPPPPSGLASPLMQQGGTGTSTGPAPLALPPGSGSVTTTTTTTSTSTGGGTGFTPPPPPPLAPPPIAPPPAIPGIAGATDGSLTGGAPNLIAPPPLGTPALPSQPQAQPVVLNETPLPGQITGGRVNVRAGPNTQYESIAVLPSGTPVTVLAQHGEWYKIVFPAEQLASIHKNMVSAEITGEIPETGLPGVVSQEDVPVHAFYWDKSTIVGRMQKGDPVVIKQERGQWYRIDAPASARAFVFARYVRLNNQGASVVADAVPPPPNPSVDMSGGTDAKTGEVKLSEADKRVAEIKDSYYKRMQERHDLDRQQEEAMIQSLREKKKLQAEQLDSALKDLDDRLANIDRETGERLTYMNQITAPATLTVVGAAAWAPPDPASGGYTGWVENIGRVGAAPSAHRLTKGGEIRFYLVSTVHNLDDFTNRRIWVDGQIQPASGASASVLHVDRIRVLTELEIADGMRQSPGYAGDAVIPGGQPVYGGYPVGGATYADSVYGGYPAGYPAGGYDASIYAAPGVVGGATMTYAADSVGTADLAVPVDVLGSSYTGGYTTSYPPAGTPAPVYSGGATGVYDMSTYGAATGAPEYALPPVGTVIGGQPYPAPGVPVTGYETTIYGTVPPTAPAQPTGPTPTDPSQLPDIVGGASGYSSSGTVVHGMGSSLGVSIGEVDSDSYENPVISEIAP